MAGTGVDTAAGTGVDTGVDTEVDTGAGIAAGIAAGSTPGCRQRAGIEAPGRGWTAIDTGRWGRGRHSCIGHRSRA